jgi:hypothetical protein
MKMDILTWVNSLVLAAVLSLAAGCATEKSPVALPAKSWTETLQAPNEHCLKIKETTPLEPASVASKLYAPEIGLVQDGPLRLVKYGWVKI